MLWLKKDDSCLFGKFCWQQRQENVKVTEMEMHIDPKVQQTAELISLATSGHWKANFIETLIQGELLFCK